MEFKNLDLVEGSDFVCSMLLNKLLEKRGVQPTCSMGFHYKCPKGSKEVADVIQNFKPKEVFQYLTSIAIMEFEGGNFLKVCNSSWGDETVFWMVGYGDYKWLKALKKKNEHKKDNRCVISWSYMTASGITHKDIDLEEPQPLYDEFYPFIKEGAQAYMDRYLKARQSILVLIGEPGTGKTSLIRDFIWRNKLKATVTFDEGVMASESYFMNYATTQAHDIMIVEDADLLLSSRNSDQNKIMSKLLNISDGLVKLDRKKIVFSTNLSNVSKIDQALVRPGRCFDVVKFDCLTKQQAEIAASKAGTLLTADKREYTLSEVFNSAVIPDRAGHEIFKFGKVG